MKSVDEVDWLKNVLKNALPNKTVKSDLVLTSAPTNLQIPKDSKVDDYGKKVRA
jgi:hypothetical protein